MILETNPEEYTRVYIDLVEQIFDKGMGEAAAETSETWDKADLEQLKFDLSEYEPNNPYQNKYRTYFSENDGDKFVFAYDKD